jgi:hypothetical protein
MRMSVHDEFFGDVVDEEAARRSSTDPQSSVVSRRNNVPILWEADRSELGGKEGRVKSTLGRVSETDLQSKFIQGAKIEAT